MVSDLAAADFLFSCDASHPDTQRYRKSWPPLVGGAGVRQETNSPMWPIPATCPLSLPAPVSCMLSAWSPLLP